MPSLRRDPCLLGAHGGEMSRRGWHFTAESSRRRVTCHADRLLVTVQTSGVELAEGLLMTAGLSVQQWD